MRGNDPVRVQRLAVQRGLQWGCSRGKQSAQRWRCESGLAEASFPLRIDSVHDAGVETDACHQQKRLPICKAGGDGAGFAPHQIIGKRSRRSVQSKFKGEHIAGAARDDAQRHGGTEQAFCRLANGAIAAGNDHRVGITKLRCGLRDFCRMAGMRRGQRPNACAAGAKRFDRRAQQLMAFAPGGRVLDQ